MKFQVTMKMNKEPKEIQFTKLIQDEIVWSVNEVQDQNPLIQEVIFITFVFRCQKTRQITTFTIFDEFWSKNSSNGKITMWLLSFDEFLSHCFSMPKKLVKSKHLHLTIFGHFNSESDRRSPSPTRSTRSRRDSIKSNRSRRSTSLKSNRSPTPYRPKSKNKSREKNRFPFLDFFQGLLLDRIRVQALQDHDVSILVIYKKRSKNCSF